MYNPYLPHTWAEPQRAAPPPPPPPPPQDHPGPPPHGDGLLDSLLERLPGGILDKVKDLDTGDLILILIVVLLFLEDKDDHLELIIMLGLMLIL